MTGSRSGTGSPGAALPDEAGYFGSFGGRLAPEALMSALDELTAAYAERVAAFRSGLDALADTEPETAS